MKKILVIDDDSAMLTLTVKALQARGFQTMTADDGVAGLEMAKKELRGNIGLALPHELLTPLNGILGFASMMMDEGMVFEPREIQDFARNIHFSALRLHRLIENFIIYSEMELNSNNAKKIEEWRQERTYVREIVTNVAREKADAAGRPDDLGLEAQDASVAMAGSYFKKAVEE